VRVLILPTLAIVSAIVVLVPTARQSCAEDSYCGLYSLYAALHSIGIQGEDFNEMCVPKYLSSETEGSTGLDLVQLAEKYGAIGTFCTGMTLANLRASAFPIVLHTSVAVSEVGFHHWVLFLGADENGIKLYDPPRGMYTVSGAELLSFWDGAGVIVQRRDDQAAIRARSLIPWVNLDLIFPVLLVLIAGGAIIRTPIVIRHPVCGILAVAFVSSLVWHATIDYGFIGNDDALANVASRLYSRRSPIVTMEEFCELAKRQDVAIVDARRPRDYKRAHVPGALNIPITATHGELRDALAAIPRYKHIVFYCQSEDCEWSDAIANQFAARGYHHRSIFRGGMNAWEIAQTAKR
jgi:rhodanese-related sulfurtransferase/predicted double-glycine peptidase